MENQVSLPVLPWQRALTTPPLVVLLLYLQNAQLSFKPALCLQEPGRQGGGLQGGEDKGWEGGAGEKGGGVMIGSWGGGMNSCVLGGFSASCDIAGRQIFIPQTV